VRAWIRIRGNGANGTWHYGDEADNLLGTARTLDTADGDDLLDGGKLPMEKGIFSFWSGFSVIDDSHSVLVHEEGTVSPRTPGNTDLYFFGYGHNYLKGLADYYHLTGRQPLIPRFVLGNWWSRYHKYTEQEYKDLVRHFEADKVPLSVAVIDMDWHLVDIDPKYGSGWTGYTWNKEFFPDYKEFLAWLHEHGLKTALNIHPADGVRGHEVMYRDMAEALDRDADAEEPIPFDIADPAYVKAAFDYIFHPYEKDGVDFWWLDWQQGGVTKVPGLDPLWMLNYYHYEDSRRDGKRGLTFSRYAGPGSHRYPIGFSGDTIVSWKSLAFQPWFTATASNIGYGWWSHDIGGHMLGYKDEELTTRWVQLGVFSPIMRLHTSDSEYMHKEPWLFNAVSKEIIERYLRLRHELIPYLYTMNLRASRDNRPIVEPLYYREPENRLLYMDYRNEYYFGSELLVSPITQPRLKSGFASVKTWIPAGGWYDIFTGLHYTGAKTLTLYRDLDNIPVLAKEGAILPMEDFSGEGYYTASTENPEHMALKVFCGQDGAFTLMEDNGLGSEYEEKNWCATKIKYCEDEKEGKLTIAAALGNTACIPEKRTWRVEFYGVKGAESAAEGSADRAEVLVNGEKAPTEYDAAKNVLSVCVGLTDTDEKIEIVVRKAAAIPETNDFRRRLNDILMEAEMENIPKMQFGAMIAGGAGKNEILSSALASDMPEEIRGAFAEVLLAE
jgi:alpha-glucosidase (family GH31 glycosyl hydrolase)